MIVGVPDGFPLSEDAASDVLDYIITTIVEGEETFHIIRQYVTNFALLYEAVEQVELINEMLPQPTRTNINAPVYALFAGALCYLCCAK